MSTTTAAPKSKMDEMTKTMIFVGVALVSLILALFMRPAPVGIEPDEQVGKPLFAEFTDPLKANGLDVLTFDEDLGKIAEFRVKQEDGIWTIPSHQGYPADAENRLEEAATMFVDLEVINVVSEAQGEHPVFGVVQPDRDKSALGDEGVGTLVTVNGTGSDGGQAKLVELIIGKEVKGVEGQHYARLPGKPRVYQLKLDPSKLSTKFEDWIETDLLKLSTFDIENISLKDYTVEIGQTLQGDLAITNYDQRLSITVHEESGKWMLDDFSESRNGELQPSSLAFDEELNGERLNTLRDSLDDLKIVDVERKPKGLGADLKADKGFLNDQDGMRSLVERGFYPVPIEEDQMDLWSSDGEILINTTDGVQYVLRFGQVAGMGEQKEDGESGGLNRYLFVTTSVNEDLFPMPEKEVPQGAESDDEAESDSEADNDDVTAESNEETAADDESGEDDGDDAEAENEEEQDADEIARIEKEYQRQLNERQENLDEAKSKVAELNFRFADWYYIISDDVFKKVRLRRADIVKISEDAQKEGTGIDAFRNLSNEGLSPVPTPPSTGEGGFPDIGN